MIQINKEDRKKIEEKSIEYNGVCRFIIGAEFGYNLGFHSRDAEVERLKEVTIDLHHENNRLKGSIHPNPFEHPISEYKLKELVWKLDREIWAKVEVHEATQSWGREQSSRLIREYFGESDNEINSLQDTINGQRLKLSELTEQLDTLKKQVEEMRTFGVKLLRWFESEKDAMRIDATKGYDELVDTYITDKQ